MLFLALLLGINAITVDNRMILHAAVNAKMTTAIAPPVIPQVIPGCMTIPNGMPSRIKHTSYKIAATRLNGMMSYFQIYSMLCSKDCECSLEVPSHIHPSKKVDCMLGNLRVPLGEESDNQCIVLTRMPYTGGIVCASHLVYTSNPLQLVDYCDSKGEGELTFKYLRDKFVLSDNQILLSGIVADAKRHTVKDNMKSLAFYGAYIDEVGCDAGCRSCKVYQKHISFVRLGSSVQCIQGKNLPIFEDGTLKRSDSLSKKDDFCAISVFPFKGGRFGFGCKSHLEIPSDTYTSSVTEVRVALEPTKGSISGSGLSIHHKGDRTIEPDSDLTLLDTTLIEGPLNLASLDTHSGSEDSDPAASKSHLV